MMLRMTAEPNETRRPTPRERLLTHSSVSGRYFESPTTGKPLVYPFPIEYAQARGWLPSWVPAARRA
jgi:hypothetical protein